MAVKAQDIVDAAAQLIGASYRTWYQGASLPMWADDGYTSAPPVSYIMEKGVMCSDLLNWARQECGLDSVGGVAAWGEALVDWYDYTSFVPGVVGGVVVEPYSGADLSLQGHVAMLYDADQTLIQSTFNGGVNINETDAQSNVWANFAWYGLMPDVDYSDAPRTQLPTYTRNGWYQVEDDKTLTPQGVIKP